MSKSTKYLTGMVVALVSATSVCVAASSASVGAPALPAPSEWPLVGLTAENLNFSPLVSISDKNVQKLGVAWATDLPTRAGTAGIPIVVDGVAYLSGQLSIVFAIDVRSGRLLWTYDPKVTFEGGFIPSLGARMNRGVAVWGDNVFVGTGDCRLVAVNRQSGRMAWQADVCMGDTDLAITASPSVGAGKVFIGPSNMDNGTRRGFVDAFDAATGKRLWRFYTIPGDPSKGFENKAMEMASKTWGKDYWKRTGGGSVYAPMTYDPELNLLYFGTSSANPDAPPDRGEGLGDELYSSSLVAVNADTGAYVWHYKQTPGNAWNYDSTSPITILNLTLAGQERRVLMHAPKNGYVYLVDAKTGKFISADQYGVRVNWSSRFDRNGRPVMMPDAEFWKTGRGVQYPSAAGAHNWMPMAYSPRTGLTYIAAMDIGNVTTYTRREQTEGLLQITAGQTHWELVSMMDDGRAPLVAWDPVARKARWKIDDPLPAGGGTLATAGNLVFYAKGDGLFRAFAADTGKVLWSTVLPGATRSTPVTIEVDGEQIILLPIGSDGSSGIGMDMGNGSTTERTRQAPARLVAFKLGGTVQLPDIDMTAAFAKPPLPRPTAEVAAQGRKVLMFYGCDYCHGGQSLQAPASTVPDLRKSNAATHAALDKIVVGGAYAVRGMPGFADMPESDLKLIQAFILDRAWAAYDVQESAKRP